MTPLGLTRAQCRVALLGYVARLRALSAALQAEPTTAALSVQDEFAFELEVDVRARSGAAGRVRMSDVERVVLAPALRRLWTRLPRPEPDVVVSAAPVLLMFAEEFEQLAGTLC